MDTRFGRLGKFCLLGLQRRECVGWSESRLGRSVWRWTNDMLGRKEGCCGLESVVCGEIVMRLIIG
jgi:hypothetical protein